MTNEWEKHAARLRELADDRTCRAYLLGRICSESSAAELADLVEACLVYRERFGASGNDRSATAPAMVRRPGAPLSEWEKGYLRGRIREAEIRDL